MWWIDRAVVALEGEHEARKHQQGPGQQTQSALERIHGGR
jgi:hypothetical protein